MVEKTLSTRKHFTQIEQLEQLSEQEKDELRKVTEQFAFRCNDYYFSLINWSDPDDPIRHIVIPHPRELEPWGRLDPSDEKAYTILPGLEHKYNSTALLLVSNQCAGLCRYCFRKRVFIEKTDDDYLQDIEGAIEYISKHGEITNVLLTGGDPLVLQTAKLEKLISRLRQIEHVQIVRIGTRVPVYNPYRIIEDASLLEMINTYSTDEKKLYVITHFVHPREITDASTEACNLIQKAGAKMCNQTPLVRGINDNPHTLAELFAKLSFIGVIPYYVFQCRPAVGNKAYTVPIEEGYKIFEQAKSKVSGLAKRARYVMSHSTGKIEIVGKTQEFVYFKYHRAADDKNSGRFLVFKSNPKACWFDDYKEIINEYPIELPYRTQGND